MRAVVTVIGKDTVGILAKVSSVCSEHNANVIEVSQSVLQDLFAMVMLIDISKINEEFSTLQSQLEKAGKQMGLSITAMHEKIFNSMHKI